MKLASFVAEGKDCFGAVVDDGVITLSGKPGFATLRDALAARDGLAAIGQAVAGARPDRKLGDIRLLPVIPNPDKILCAGINYRSHAAETGRELPKQPSMFIRLANTLTGHDGEMIRHHHAILAAIRDDGGRERGSLGDMALQQIPDGSEIALVDDVGKIEPRGLEQTVIGIHLTKREHKEIVGAEIEPTPIIALTRHEGVGLRIVASALRALGEGVDGRSGVLRNALQELQEIVGAGIETRLTIRKAPIEPFIERN